jgi:phosphatidylglycerol---prolipoprotein diacylglyceryl transferase
VNPVLLEWGPEGARTIVLAYEVAFWAAGVLAVAVGVLVAWRMRLPVRRTAALLVCAAIAVPVGARVLFVLEYPAFFTGAEPLDAFEISTAHFSLMGGVLLAVLVTLAGVRLLHLDLWRTADALAPGLALGIAVMRTGCFLAGCCYGVVTTGPLGVVFPPGSVAHLVQMGNGVIGLFDAALPVYPTQLFELAGALLAGALALSLLWRRAPSGVPFLAAAALFAAVRWAVWPLRYYPEAFSGPKWEYPVLYAGVIAVLIALAVWRMRPTRAGGTGGPTRADPETGPEARCE